MLIGAHVSIAGGVSQAFDRAVAHGAKCLQLFTKTARGWAGPALTEDERRAFRKKGRETGLPALAHGSYLVNLGTEDTTLWDRSIACVVDELTRCEALGIPFLVYHPGAHKDAERGLKRIARALDEIHAATPGFKTRLCLENTAGQGVCLGFRFEHLEEILLKVRDERRLGVCLDTCHLFAAGYDVVTPRGYEQVFEELDKRVGLLRVRCLHLNDSKKGLGCRVDRHEEIGKGTMGLRFFKSLVRDVRFKDTAAVLETPFPERYGEAIGLLESLVRK